jgi:hypothetical protein
MSELSNFNFERRFHPEKPGRPENLRTPEEAKRYEAREMAALNEILWDLFRNRLNVSLEHSGDVKTEADAALDCLCRLTESLAQRDPEMCRILIEEFETGPHPSDEPWDIPEVLRRQMGLPPRDRGAAPPPEHEQ